MLKETFEDKLYKMLMPAFRARYKIVQHFDSDFFKSDVGKTELLSMALISHRIRNHHVKAPINKEQLDEIYTNEGSPDLFYERGSYILSLAHTFEYPVDYERMNEQLMNLFENFAKDAGVDPLYNAFDMPEGVQARLNSNAYVLDWDLMKKSELLKASIPTYEIENKEHQPQKIPSQILNNFCEREKEFEKQRNLRNELLARYNDVKNNPSFDTYQRLNRIKNIIEQRNNYPVQNQKTEQPNQKIQMPIRSISH